MQIFLKKYFELIKLVKKNNKILIICTKSFLSSQIINDIKNNCNKVFIFSNFKPNPTDSNVKEALNILKNNKCNFIISIGGGSSIDIAKCVKAWANLNNKKSYFEQEISENNLLHLAIPTTAGTGSESTHFAVIYDNEGVKHSISHGSLIPDFVYLNPKFLESLPEYQKKSTLLDAMCQSIESYWSVNSTKESRKYAKKSLKLILKKYKRYINGNNNVNKYILKAANLSGKAINISKTTAPHAMSYKITSLYKISHGVAVAVLLPHVWEYMINNIDKTVDKRGKKYLNNIFKKLDKIFKSKNHNETIQKLFEMYKTLNIEYCKIIKREDVEFLTDSVNVERLKNNPVALNKKTIRNIYEKLI